LIYFSLVIIRFDKNTKNDGCFSPKKKMAMKRIFR
jgi:hypothetical protein